MTALSTAFTRDVTDSWREISDDEIQKMRQLLLSVDHESQDTQLLKKERLAFDAVEELAQMRLSVNQRLGECRKKKLLFDRKQADLRKMALDNEQYIKDLDKKIETCEKKVKEETVEYRRLSDEIIQLTEKLQERELEKEECVKHIRRAAPYKRLFEKAVQVYDEEFEGDIENIIKREHALRMTATELEENSTRMQKKLESLKENWLVDQSRLQNDQLIVNSTLHEAQINLENSRVELREADNKLKCAKEEKEWKESNYGVMKLAIEQILQLTVASCRLPQRKKAMLDFVDAPKGQEERYGTDLFLMAISERLTELLWLKEKAADFTKGKITLDDVPTAIVSSSEVEFQFPS